MKRTRSREIESVNQVFKEIEQNLDSVQLLQPNSKASESATTTQIKKPTDPRERVATKPPKVQKAGKRSENSSSMRQVDEIDISEIRHSDIKHRKQHYTKAQDFQSRNQSTSL